MRTKEPIVGSLLRLLFDELVDQTAELQEARLTSEDLKEEDEARLRAMLAFDKAVNWPPKERWRIVQNMALSDDVRQHVLRMLACDNEVPSLLRGSAAAVLRFIGEDESGIMPLERSLLGTMIGTFTLDELIGEGGSAVVFKATRSAGDGQQTVALKLLRTGLFSTEARSRFRREQSILAQFTHPNIARLVEGGVNALGLPYIAMEFIDGEPITCAADRRGLDVRERLLWFLRLCQVIESAHAVLVVHCDIKPSNVLVTQQDELKVLDFGIAKLLADDEVFHQSAPTALTPEYAAPEQFGHHKLTAAVDVYALGVLLSELLTGHRLDGNHRASATVSQGGRADRLPPGLPERRILARVLRGDLDAVLTKALAEDPSIRYHTATALAQDVRNYLNGMPVHALPQSQSYFLRKFLLRHRIGIVVAISFAMLLCSAFVAVIWQADVARKQAVLARAQTARAEAVRRFLVGVFEQTEPDELRGAAITAQQLLEVGARQIIATEDPELRADLNTLLGTLYWDLSDYGHAAPFLQAAVATSENPGVSEETKARALLALARSESQKREFDTALEHVRLAGDWARKAGAAGVDLISDINRLRSDTLVTSGRALEAKPILEATIKSDLARLPPGAEAVGQDLLSLGQTLDELGQWAEAQKRLKEAETLMRRLHGDQHSAVADVLTAEGLMLGHKGELAEGERFLKEAYAINLQIYGEDHRETLLSRSNLLSIQERQGHFAEALEGRIALLTSERHYADARPERIAYTYHFLANDYRGLGRFAEAEAAARASLAAWRRVQGDNESEDSAEPYETLGDVLSLQGHYEEAEVAIRKAIAIQLAHVGEDSIYLNTARADLAHVLRLRNKYGEALSQARSALDALRSSGREPDRYFANVETQLSEAELDNGDPQAARSSAEEALTIGRRTRPPGSYVLGNSLFALARADLALGRFEEAVPLLHEALNVRTVSMPSADPRVLELKVALAIALEALGRCDAARDVRVESKSALERSTSPYAQELLRRLRSGVVRERPPNSCA